MSQNFFYGLSAALMGAAIVVVQPQIAVPQTDEQAIASLARDATVVINGQNPGSGVIISRQGNTYYVLTAKHVVATQDEYEIVTSDGSKYPLNYSTVKKLPGIDLALVQFTSDKNYLVAQVGDSDKVTEGATVYISGWPHPGRAITQRIFQLTSGKISGRPLGNLEGGYALVYTKTTRSGMSGGPVLDANGVVIGIHGQGDREAGDQETEPTAGEKTGFNLGIPINSFVGFASQNEIKLHYFGYNFFENLDRVKIINGHSGAVLSLKIALDNRTLISGSTDGTIKVWDLQTGKLLRTITGHPSGTREIAIAPDGQTLASRGSDGTIKLWNLQTGKLLRTITDDSKYVFSVTFSPDGQTLASSSDDATVKFWNWNTGQLSHTLKLSNTYNVAFSLDGKTVASGDSNSTISLWNIQTGKLQATITDNCLGEHSLANQVWPFTLSPFAEKIVGRCITGDTIKVWNTTTSQLLYTIEKSEPEALAINPYGQLLAGVDRRGNINIWNLHTGQLLRNIQLDDLDSQGNYLGEAALRSVAFSADGQTLVVGTFRYQTNPKAGLIYIFRLAGH